jgi:hypothetical protein
VVIVSSSGAEVVEPIGLMLGADYVVATQMVVADGKYTGEIAYYAYGPTKAEAMRDLAAKRGYDLSQCYAYSDSQTDVPMLEAVGFPHAVNPDRELARIASDREWPVLRFSTPVAMRRRLPKMSELEPRQRVVLAGAGAAALALTASAALWYATRERRVHTAMAKKRRTHPALSAQIRRATEAPC